MANTEGITVTHRPDAVVLDLDLDVGYLLFLSPGRTERLIAELVDRLDTVRLVGVWIQRGGEC